MRYILLSLALTSPAFADVKTPSGKVIDCYCTDTQGSRVELGELVCLFVDGRAFIAQCDMSLNVPIWRDIGQGCVSSFNAAPDQALPASRPAAPG